MIYLLVEGKNVYIGIFKSWLDKLYLNDLIGGLLMFIYKIEKKVNFIKLFKL